jgi:RNA polymerase sigma factor (sigma-70 family)
MAGDRAAFEALVHSYGKDVLRVCFSVLGDLDAAKDAAQTTWIQAWRRLPKLRDDTRFRSWLLAVAANEARQSARSSARRSVRESRIQADHYQSDEVTSIDAVRLETSLARMRVGDRELLALRYVAGLTSPEIAALRGISAAGVRGRLSRIVAQLRKDLVDG